jgi:biotin transport system substrate-specific component
MSQARVLDAGRPLVLADALVGVPTAAQDAGLVAVMTLLIALCARISIPLPHTPVPITGTTLGVLYAGAWLGPRRGALCAALYLLLGGLGLPFFAAGASGWSHFFGATGGYLVGFLPAAWLTGKLAARGWDRNPVGALAAMLLGSFVIFACGLSVLSFYVPSGQVLEKGLYPFIIGDLAKSCLSAGLLPLGWKALGRRD